MKNILDLLFCSSQIGKKATVGKFTCKGGGCDGMRDTEGSERQKEIRSEGRWREKAFSYAKVSSCNLRQ